MSEKLVWFTSSPTQTPGIWMVWDMYAGTDGDVPLVQVFHGSMEECSAVADQKNAALPARVAGGKPDPTVPTAAP